MACIFGEVGGAQDDGSGFEVEGDVAFEDDGAAEIDAGREIDDAAALGVGAIDGGVDGGGVEGDAVDFCSEGLGAEEVLEGLGGLRRGLRKDEGSGGDSGGAEELDEVATIHAEWFLWG